MTTYGTDIRVTANLKIGNGTQLFSRIYRNVGLGDKDAHDEARDLARADIAKMSNVTEYNSMQSEEL